MAELSFSSGIDDGLKKDLEGINSEMNRFGKNAEKIANSIDAAFEKAFQTAPTSIEELNEAIKMQKVTVKELEAQYKKTADEIAKLPASRTKIGLEEDLQKQLNAIEEEKAALAGLTAAQDGTKTSSTQLRTELMNIRDEMSRLRLEGKENTEEYRVLEEQMAKLGTAYRQVTAEQKALTSGGTQIAGVVQGLQGLLGAYSVGSGAIGLFVSDSEKLIAVQTRMQSIMAILMGMQQVANTLHSTSAFRITTVAKVTRLWGAANQFVSAGLVKLGISANIATIAAKALTATLTLGLGTAITAAVVFIQRLIDKNAEAKKEQQAYTKAVSENVASQIASYKKLESEYDAMGTDMKKRQDFVEKYADEFKKLGLTINTVADAEKLFKEQGDAVINSLYLRAQATATYNQAIEKYKQASDARTRYEEELAKATRFEKQGGRIVKVVRETDDVREAKEQYDELTEAANRFVEESVRLNNEASKLIETTGLSVEGEAEVVEGSIESYKKLIAEKQKEQQTMATTSKQYAELQKQIEGYEELIENVTQSQAQSKILEALELSNQKRINEIKRQGEREAITEEQMREKLLDNEIKYLQERRKIAITELERRKIDEQILNLRMQKEADRKAAQQKRKDEEKAADEQFKQLLFKYETYLQKRDRLIAEADKDIASLAAKNVEGIYDDNIQEVKKMLEKNLQELDSSFLETSTGIYRLFQDTKSKSLKEIQELVVGAEQLLAMVTGDSDFVEGNMFGISPEQLAVLQESPETIELIRQAVERLRAETDKASNSFELFAQGLEALKEGDTKKGIQDMGAALNDFSEAAIFVADTLRELGEATGVEFLSTISSYVEDTANVLGSVLQGASLGMAVGGPVGAAIGGAIGLIKGVATIAKRVKQENDGLREDVARTEQSISTSMDKYASSLEELEKRFDNIFGDDEFGKAFRATAQSIDAASESLETYIGKLGALDVKTKEGGWFKKDTYTNILKLYPELIDAQGNLNKQVAEGILAADSLDEAQTEVLQGALDNALAIEDAYARMADYLAGIFGNVATDITQAFQDMYVSGDDAMESLRESFSGMIEQFTRDAIQFSFLQPYLDELNATTKKIGEQFAGGDISAEQLQQRIVTSLGSFYASLEELQPAILQAYENADKLAEQAGFVNAFSPADSSTNGTSIAGRIQQAITEETGSELVGRLGAIMLSNERMLGISSDMLDYAIQNLVTLNRIKENTDYLPEIADNTRKTYQHLENI